jgi:hypothetical protein
MKRSRVVGFIGVLGSLSTVGAFSVAFSACSDDGAITVAPPEDGGTTGQDSSGPPPVIGGGNDAALEPDNFVPPGCVVTSTPADDPCVIIEALGVFVSKKLGGAVAGGGSGTLAAPFASLQKGIATAKLLKKRVYVCAETYDEAITFENGVSVFGYFDCSKPTWTVSQPPVATDGGADAGDAGAVVSLRARIASPVSPAAHAVGIANDTLIDSIDIVAPDATAPSGSSIGLIAQNSPKLEIKNMKVHAGTAAKGADGTPGPLPGDGFGNKNGADGYSPAWCHLPPGSCISGDPCIDPVCVAQHSTRPGGTNVCAGTQGGNGGAGGNFIKETSSLCKFTYSDVNLRHVGDGDVRPATATTALGGVGAPLCAQTATNGATGAKGAAGTNGAASPGGTITATGFTAGDGTNGTNGANGQGGGGGGGAMPKNPNSAYYANGLDYWGSSGSGGGAGGCAGLAGTAGKGGGASIGVILFDSPLTLRNVVVSASNGGAGGMGSFGSVATAPGEAGQAFGSDSIGTLGGRGGEGGDSGVSGGGAGGSSIGIATHGTPALLFNTPTPTIGAAGAGDPGMYDGFTGKAVPAAGSGVAVAMHTF